MDVLLCIFTLLLCMCVGIYAMLRVSLSSYVLSVRNVCLHVSLGLDVVVCAIVMYLCMRVWYVFMYVCVYVMLVSMHVV